ncbi:hypothetical protein CCP2SC5_220003 [Azospirillaceae bacterium]
MWIWKTLNQAIGELINGSAAITVKKTAAAHIGRLKKTEVKLCITS